MGLFTEADTQLALLRGLLGDALEPADLVSAMDRLDDDHCVRAITAADALARFSERLRAVGAGTLAARSPRDAGHGGLAQSRGHRNAIALVQDLTGSSQAEAARQVRVGEALREIAQADAVRLGADETGRGTDPGGAAVGDVAVGDAAVGGRGADGRGAEEGASVCAGTPPGRGMPWHAALGLAVLSGAITTAQHDAIRRGLGEPPAPRAAPGGAPADARGGPVDVGRGEDAGDVGRGEDPAGAGDDAACQAWATAAEQLIAAAGHDSPEQLAGAARAIRDILDPEGAEARFLARYERRALRTWTDRDGARRASISFDDEGGAFFDAIVAAAMRPRRGGPRFVDPEEKAAAAELTADPRRNDQLVYDLFLDLVRAGVLADAKAVLGARQPGLRLVQPVDVDGTAGAVVMTEDGLTALPSGVAERRRCEAGSVTVTVDPCGNPLDVGRESRLFTSRQRIGLAIRDGGCRWSGCDRPASYCEAHHIDEWHRDLGNTDVDRGILLCRFHHMNLHHGRWRITRNGKQGFVLHHRDGEQIPLPQRPALRYLFRGIDPPPQRFRRVA
ncbi:HNH endonuclease signature motif containing protein [Microbacterium sp.]|uniref:HNH endonuclease signature motif containing protein n=1 Tax=Microbacterium sp. TaxID=51671 RepID=UPI001AC98794|nr:HNH endonuclease signature motif containing protein [Microbacterium sp.]MBN9158936.1 DUF222 domain-containing protein [Microbacterium sp.]